jgi:hypothetical protein
MPPGIGRSGAGAWITASAQARQPPAFAGAGSARAPGDPDPEAQRDHVKLLGDIFRDHVHRAAAARAALVGDVEDDLVALQMRRQVTAVALRRAACPGLRLGRGLDRLLSRGDGSDVLLEPFQGELELLGVDALGLAAVPGADQLLDRQLQFFQFRFQNIALIQQRRMLSAQLLIRRLQSIKRRPFINKYCSEFL